MKKIIKNTSNDMLSIIGVDLKVNQEYELPEGEWPKLASDEAALDLIETGAVSLLDGEYQMNAQQGLLWAKSLHSGFNPNYFWGKSFLETKTNSTEWVRKIRIRTDDIAFGLYKICGTFQWNHVKKKFGFKSRVVFDVYDILWEFHQNPLNVDDYFSISFFVLKDLIHDGRKSHTVDLEFCSESGHSATMKNAFLEVFRVS